MTHTQIDALILGPPLASAVLFGIWAAIDIYRGKQYSKQIKAWGANYSKATTALHRPGVDLTTDPDYQWAVQQASQPIPDYHRTWPMRGTVR